MANRITDETNVNLAFISEQKAVIRMEKDKARMADVFLELDDDDDSL